MNCSHSWRKHENSCKTIIIRARSRHDIAACGRGFGPNERTSRQALAEAGVVHGHRWLPAGSIRKILRSVWATRFQAVARQRRLVRNNHYSHATTYTSVGHATLLSCAHPYKHGVIGNDWIDRTTGKRMYSTEDG